MTPALADTRDIVFSPPAFCAVIAASPVAANMMGLPEGEPDGVCMVPAEARVEIVYGQGSRARGFSLDAAALGALLIGYCRRARIPLPRHSRKALAVYDNRITLSIITELPELPATVVPESAQGVRRRITEGRVSWVDPSRVWASRPRPNPEARAPVPA